MHLVTGTQLGANFFESHSSYFYHFTAYTYIKDGAPSEELPEVLNNTRPHLLEFEKQFHISISSFSKIFRIAGYHHRLQNT